MAYVIRSGKYESGTEEQQMAYRQLFGKDVQYRFDLYFHWYNLIHELGHSFVSESGREIPDLPQEMFVNEFAVAYYRYAGENDRLDELQSILEEIINSIPAPMPEGEAFLDYYERIWNTEELMQVMTYGYFQLNSVLEAMKKRKSFEETAGELGFRLHPADVKRADTEISSGNAEAVLNTALENMRMCGMTVPKIRLELVDDPTIQCVRWEESSAL